MIVLTFEADIDVPDINDITEHNWELAGLEEKEKRSVRRFKVSKNRMLLESRTVYDTVADVRSGRPSGKEWIPAGLSGKLQVQGLIKDELYEFTMSVEDGEVIRIS